MPLPPIPVASVQPFPYRYGLLPDFEWAYAVCNCVWMLEPNFTLENGALRVIPARTNGAKKPQEGISRLTLSHPQELPGPPDAPEGSGQ